MRNIKIKTKKEQRKHDSIIFCQKRKYHRIKLQCTQYLGGKCMVCGYDKCINALDFHHRNPKEKSFTIGDNIMKSFDTLKPELDKCNLLCVNCHRKIHESKKPRKKKKELVLYKGGICLLCGFNSCNNSLEFHHLNPSKKDFTIGNSKKPIEEMKVELDKCVLLCANCHRETHSGLTKYSLEKDMFAKEIFPMILNHVIKPEKQKTNCLICNKETVWFGDYCSHECASKASRKHEWNKEELEKLISDGNSLEQIGKLFDVTGAAVKKWCKKFDVKYKTKTYNGHNNKK